MPSSTRSNRSKSRYKIFESNEVIDSLNDFKAQEESKLVQAKQLERSRREQFLNHRHLGSLILYWAIIVLILAGGFVWGWNTFLPHCIRFLDPDEIIKIETIAKGGLLGFVLSDLQKKFKE